MIKTVEWFLENRQLIRDETMKRLSDAYMRKARTNVITMELLSKAPSFRDVLGLPEDYDPNEWVVIAAYYAMYISALSVLARLGYKSKNHTATITALDEFFVKKRMLRKEFLQILERLRIRKEEIEGLRKARDRREIALLSD